MNFKNKNWEDYHDPNQTILFLAQLLTDGKLGLLLGAGTSAGFGLPSWEELVKRCCGSSYSGNLEVDIEKFKQTINNQNIYTEKVREALYDGILLNFDLPTNKNLIIAISSLIIGKTRGNVEKVLNLNFDSILEWYLKVNGLKVVINSNEGTVVGNKDVEIIHPHGYLPNDVLKSNSSDNIILSWDELEKFKQDKENYLKDLTYYFLKTKCFLSVGVSPRTLKDYISSYIVHIKGIYEKHNLDRDIPFGFALVQDSEYELSVRDNLRENYGIILLKVEHSDIPKYLFSISQHRMGLDSIGFGSAALN